MHAHSSSFLTLFHLPKTVLSTRAIRDHAFVDESRSLVYERVERFVPHIVRDMKYAAEKDEDVVRQSSARGLHVDAGQQRPKLNRAQAALRFTGFLLTFDAGGAITALAPSKQSDILGGLVDSLAAYKTRDKVNYYHHISSSPLPIYLSSLYGRWYMQLITTTAPLSVPLFL